MKIIHGKTTKSKKLKRYKNKIKKRTEKIGCQVGMNFKIINLMSMME